MPAPISADCTRGSRSPGNGVKTAGRAGSPLLEDERAVLAATAREHVVERRAHAGSRGSSERDERSEHRQAGGADERGAQRRVVGQHAEQRSCASEPRPMLSPSVTPEAKPTCRGSARWAITTIG